MMVQQIISIDGNVLSLHPLLQNYLIFELRDIHQPRTQAFSSWGGKSLGTRLNIHMPLSGARIRYPFIGTFSTCIVRFPICNWAQYGIVMYQSVLILSKEFVFTGMWARIYVNITLPFLKINTLVLRIHTNCKELPENLSDLIGTHVLTNLTLLQLIRHDHSTMKATESLNSLKQGQYLNTILSK